TMLTKITKYAATAFFILAIVLSLLQNAYHNRHISAFGEYLGKSPRQEAPASLPPATTPATPPPSSTPNTLSGTSNFPLMVTSNTPPSIGPAESTNTPALTNTAPQSVPK